MVSAADIIWITIAVALGVVVLALLVDLFRKVVIVEKGTTVVVERLGRFRCVLHEGLHFLAPFMDYPRAVTWRVTETYTDARHRQHVSIFQTRITRIDMREQVFDFANQEVITRDNVAITVHPILIFQLVDPVKVAYQTYDLPTAVTNLVQTSLRAIIGDMGLDDTLASREEINRSVHGKISRIALDWGMQINQVEVLEIFPTASIQAAMHKQLSAERLRRAAIVAAEGYREQVRTEAEGASQAAIALSTGEAAVMRLNAEGQAKTKELIADAEAQAVAALAEALREFEVEPTQYLVALRYLEAFLDVARKAAKRVMVFPYQASLNGALKQLALGDGADKSQ